MSRKSLQTRKLHLERIKAAQAGQCRVERNTSGGHRLRMSVAERASSTGVKVVERAKRAQLFVYI